MQYKYCKVCYKPFKPNGNAVCCSKECMLENKRASRRRSWHNNRPDRYSENLRLRMWRIQQRILNGNNN